MLTLRALDPDQDLELFKLAYSWRAKPKRHTQPDRMDFSDFAAPDPSQIVMGLFKGELVAVYLFREWEQGKYEAHFTSKRGTPRTHVLAGARRILTWFMDNGAVEVSCFVRPRNRAVRRFVTELGFGVESRVIFACIEQFLHGIVAPSFVKYVCTPATSQEVCHRIKRQKTDYEPNANAARSNDCRV